MRSFSWGFLAEGPCRSSTTDGKWQIYKDKDGTHNNGATTDRSDRGSGKDKET